MAKLKLENSDLRKALAGGREGTASVSVGGPGVAVLQYRIAELQTRERVLVRKRGELETE